MKKLLRPIASLFCIGIVVLYFVKPTFTTDTTANNLYFSLSVHACGIIAFLLLLWEMEYKTLYKPSAKNLLIAIPCFLVVINNLPTLSLIWGDCHVTRTDLLFLYVLETLSIGLFEEIAFRGVLYLAILERHRTSKKQIFWCTVLSSALFAIFHLTNLLEGAGVGETIMQVGYSFLIGGMCAVIFLRTKNIIFPILLHTIFDFCGKLLPTLGSGTWWDTPTVIFTAVLATLTTVHVLVCLKNIEPQSLDCLFPSQEKAETTPIQQ